MNCLSLNIRGIGGVSKVRLLKELLIKESVEFLALQETLISGDAARFVNIIWSQGEYGFCQVPANANGRSGGILCVWNKGSFDVVGAFAGNGFLCVEGRWKGSLDLITIINVYAPQDDGMKRTLWLDYARTSLRLPSISVF